ncbi:MAG: DUF2281 domain-containing protein [Methanoregulaceae archaeon]
MESLETKIERLPPELQKEVEDYIDFLIAKHKPSERASVPQNPQPQVLVETRSFPFFPQTTEPERLPMPSLEPASDQQEEPAIPEEARPAGPIIFADERGTPTKSAPPEEDRLTRSYLDYGALEDAPAEKKPASRNIMRNGTKDGKPAQPVDLDWV